MRQKADFLQLPRRRLKAGIINAAIGGAMMDQTANLERLNALFQIPEVKGGFPSQDALLSWGNRVVPLLRFNQQCHETFRYHLWVISHDVSSHTAVPAFRIMVSQVEMAIEELKIDISNQSQAVPAPKEAPNAEASIWKLEPNLWGLGINLPVMLRRFKDWRERKKPNP